MNFFVICKCIYSKDLCEGELLRKWNWVILTRPGREYFSWCVVVHAPRIPHVRCQFHARRTMSDAWFVICVYLGAWWLFVFFCGITCCFLYSRYYFPVFSQVIPLFLTVFLKYINWKNRVKCYKKQERITSSSLQWSAILIQNIFIAK